MVKAIAIDFDWTLLRTDKTISKYTLNILEQCRSNGIKVVYATARPLRTITPYLQLAPCDAIIYHNGAHIVADGNRVDDPQTIPIETAESILAYLQKLFLGHRLSVEINDVLYANFDVSSIWKYTESTLSDFSNLPRIDADKILVEANRGINYEHVSPLLTPDIYCQIAEGSVYLIMHKNATKLKAIKKLSKYWDIPIQDFAAFGDDHNDVEMIKYCGIGVAVGNAIPEVINAADHVTDTNENDGVAKYIANNLL